MRAALSASCRGLDRARGARARRAARAARGRGARAAAAGGQAGGASGGGGGGGGGAEDKAMWRAMLENARRKREAENAAQSGTGREDIDNIAAAEAEAGDTDAGEQFALVAAAETDSALGAGEGDAAGAGEAAGAAKEQPDAAVAASGLSESLSNFKLRTGLSDEPLVERWRDTPPLDGDESLEDLRESKSALFHMKPDYGLTWATDREDLALSDADWAEKWFSNPIMRTEPPGEALKPDGTVLSKEGYYRFNVDDAEFLVRQTEEGFFDLGDVWVQAEPMVKRNHVLYKDVSYVEWAAGQQVPYVRCEARGFEPGTPQLFSVWRFNMTEARDFDIRQWHEPYPERVPFMDTIIREKLEAVYLTPVETHIPIGPRCEFRPPDEELRIDKTIEQRNDECDWWLPPMFEFKPLHNELFKLDGEARAIVKVDVRGPHADTLDEPALMYRSGEWRVMEARHLPSMQRVAQEQAWADACKDRAAYEKKRLRVDDVDESVFENMTNDLEFDLGESDAPEIDSM